MRSQGFHIGLVQATGQSGGGVYNYTLCMIDALNEVDPSIRLTLLRWPKMAPILQDRFHSRWRVLDLPDAIRTTPTDIRPFLREPGFRLDRAYVNRMAYGFLDSHQLDLLIHPVPHPFAFECGKPFLMAIHDLQHRLQPEFPEVSADGQWGYREYLYSNATRYAEGILVDSVVGKEDVLQCYPDLIDPKRIHILPFASAIQRSPALLADSHIQSVKTRYRLPERYLFYPAQFWLHKNHARIVQALQGIRIEHGLDVPLVLVGSNRGFPYERREQVFDHITRLAEQLGVYDLIHYLGYVPEQDMPALYALADALVMPTFFGPTNIPIYEAWEFGCAVITSDIRGIREQVEEAGLLVDPRAPMSIAEGIRTVWTDEDRRRDLIQKGKLRLGRFSRDAFRSRVLEIIGNLAPATHRSSAPYSISNTPGQNLTDHSSPDGGCEPSSPVASLDVESARSDGEAAPESLNPDGSPAVIMSMSVGRSNPAPSTALPQMREQLGRWYLSCNNDDLHRMYAGPAGKIFRRIITEPPGVVSDPPPDSPALGQLIRGLKAAQSAEERLKHVMGLMLFLPAHEVGELVDHRDLPGWFREDFLRFLLRPARTFRNPAEQEAVFRHLRRQLEAMRQLILEEPQERATQRLAMTFSEHVGFLPCYFSAQALKPLLIERAEILAYALRHQGCELNRPVQPRPATNSKIRIGVYSRSIFPCSETFATLPVFKCLDRARFEVGLYVHHSDSNHLENIARRVVDRFTVLPESANQSARIMRSEDLDILLFGNNLTAAYGPGVVLASHRLARIQMIHFCNPVTSGLLHMDRFLIGSLIGQEAGSESEFTEKTLTVEGSGICFDIQPSPPSPVPGISRDDLGLSHQETVFISGANLFKIIPGMRHTWARIMREIPNSALVLYPFGPAWAADYPKKRFIAEFTRILAEHGVSANRLVVADTLKGREQVSALNRIADVYLDAVPYSGATSLLDPLQAGLPAVVMEGSELRFAQGAAMLKELGVPELITRNEDEYIRLAVRIGTNKGVREGFSRRINERMGAGPDFLNPSLYGRRISRAMLSLFPNFQDRAASESGAPAEHRTCLSSAVL